MSHFLPWSNIHTDKNEVSLKSPSPISMYTQTSLHSSTGLSSRAPGLSIPTRMRSLVLLMADFCNLDRLMAVISSRSKG
jgi:hypothetical protein